MTDESHAYTDNGDDMEFTLDFDDLELNFDTESDNDANVDSNANNSVSNDSTTDNTDNLSDDNMTASSAARTSDYIPFSERRKMRNSAPSQDSSRDSLSSVSSANDTTSVSGDSSAGNSHTAATRDVRETRETPAGTVSVMRTMDTPVDNAGSVATGDKVAEEVVLQDDNPIGTVSASTVKITPPGKKKALFDKSKITEKEENFNLTEDYAFKSYVGGANEVTKHLEQRQRELRVKYGNNSPLKVAKIINAEIVMSAPKKYFDKYSESVEKGISYCRMKIADGGESYAETINTANQNPTVESYQDDAYIMVARFINEFLSTTEYRGIERDIVLNLIINELLGFDALDPLWHDERITEIVCNGPNDIQAEIAGEMQRVPSLSFRNREHLEKLLERLFSGVGKILAQSTPQAKGRLHDKSRIFATHHSISPDGPNFNIRRHPHGFWTPQALIDRGAASEEIMAYLGNLIHKGASYIIAGGTSTGKSLAHNEMLATPSGMITMGEISPGDKVFDYAGNVCTVTDKFTNPARQVYAVKFSTGNTVYVDAEHNWFVSSFQSRKTLDNIPTHSNENLNDQKDKKADLWQVKTTQEMIDEGVYLKNEGAKDGHYNFRVPKLEKAVEFDNAKDVDELPIHPYLLGLWLGNGQSNGAGFTGTQEDVEFYKSVLPNSFKSYEKDNKSHAITAPDFKNILSELDILQTETGKTEKRIPAEYLYASKEARRELIAGLIDSDGTCLSNNIGWEFYNTNAQLVKGFIQVASSLGYRVNISEDEHKTYVNKGEKETTTTPSQIATILTEDSLAKLPRKVAKHKEIAKAHPLLDDDVNNVSIVSIEAVEGRVEEMSCITVDSPHSTYMVSEHFTTTHNTSMLNALTGFYPSNARILTLEDNLEMKPNPKKFLAAAMETRPPSPDKPNDRGVTMRDLVWGAMQMRPEVLIIGEVTDSAAYDLCQALNTGHAGASTFHANSSQLAVTRVASLVAQSGLATIEGAYDLISAAFDFVINVRHFPQDGSRRIFSIDEVGSQTYFKDGKLILPTKPIWKFDESGIDDNGNIVGKWTKVGDISAERSERRMFDYQRTLSWDELQVLSALPEGNEAV